MNTSLRILALLYFGFSLGNVSEGRAGERRHSPDGGNHPRSISWIETHAAVVEAVQRTGRPILVYAKSASCGYCRIMEQKTWRDPRVAAAVTARFVPFRLKADTEPVLMRRLQVRSFPTTMLFSSRGTHLLTLEGYLSPDRLLEILDRTKTGREGSPPAPRSDRSR